ncbi:DUF551 domain-containing protein [Enterobacter hormaechei]
MITLTKEWLQQTIAELEEERDATPGAVNEDAAMSLAAMKIALASLEAEPGVNHQPVAWQYKEYVHVRGLGYLWLEKLECEFPGADCETLKDVVPLYIAPPVPVSVPEMKPVDLDEGFEEWYSEGESGAGSVAPGWFSEAMKPVFLGTWRACRAAMLKGADGNSPVIPDGWVACSERMPKKGEEVLCTDQFENYETALYDTGYIPGPPFFATTAGEFHPTHWMPLPAAPQQEVKS